MNHKHLIKLFLIAVIFVSGFTAPSFAGEVTAAPFFVPGFPMLAGKEVMLMWAPVNGAVKYRVYLGKKQIAELPATSFTYQAPTRPGNYYFSVSGVSDLGDEGPVSMESELKVTMLNPPSDFDHKFFGRILNLRWKGAPGAVMYKVFRSKTRRGIYDLIGDAYDMRYVDSRVKETRGNLGKSFFYKVMSIDKHNRISVHSEVYEVKIKKPFSTIVNTAVYHNIKEVSFIKPDIDKDINLCYDINFSSDKKNLLFTDDLSKSVTRIDSKGMVQNIIDVKFWNPYKIAVDEGDNIFMIDKEGKKILSYTKKGNLNFAADSHPLTEWYMADAFRPLKRRGAVKFTGIEVYKGKIYAGDSETGAIHIYDKESGDFEKYFKLGGDFYALVPRFYDLNNLLIDEKAGKIYISSSERSIIDVHDIKTGNQLYKIGESLNLVGAFRSISDMVLDRAGNLLVADPAMRSIQVFSGEDGRYLYSLSDKEGFRPVRKRSNLKKSVFSFDYTPMHMNFDNDGRLWIYFPEKKGISIREPLDYDILAADNKTKKH
jgi:sugar lactone lactonase YvrE